MHRAMIIARQLNEQYLLDMCLEWKTGRSNRILMGKTLEINHFEHKSQLEICGDVSC